MRTRFGGEEHLLSGEGELGGNIPRFLRLIFVEQFAVVDFKGDVIEFRTGDRAGNGEDVVADAYEFDTAVEVGLHRAAEESRAREVGIGVDVARHFFRERCFFHPLEDVDTPAVRFWKSSGDPMVVPQRERELPDVVLTDGGLHAGAGTSQRRQQQAEHDADDEQHDQ